MQIAVATSSQQLQVDRLLAPDGRCLGVFTSGLALRAARAAWTIAGFKVRSVATTLSPCHLEQVDAGDGDRLDYLLNPSDTTIGARVTAWLGQGAVEVVVTRRCINTLTSPAGDKCGVGGDVVVSLLVKAPN